VLKVQAQQDVPRAYATNFNVPGNVRPVPECLYGRTGQIFYLDLEKMTTEFCPGS